MSNLFFALDWLALPLYILLGTIFLWFGYRFLRSIGDGRATTFELERDLSRRKQVNAITVMILTIEFGVLVAGAQVRAVPFLEAERDLEAIQQERIALQQQDGVFATATPPAVLQGGLDIPEGTPLVESVQEGFLPTPTATFTPVGTIVANAPPPRGCDDGRAFLEVPGNGMRVFEPTTVRGIAFTDNFRSAKLEIRGPQTQDQWTVLQTLTVPAQTLTVLSQFIPSSYTAGRYEFRLAVFDLSNELVAVCMVNIYISEPPVTATPDA